MTPEDKTESPDLEHDNHEDTTDADIDAKLAAANAAKTADIETPPVDEAKDGQETHHGLKPFGVYPHPTNTTNNTGH